MIKLIRVFAGVALLLSFVPRAASATTLLHRFVVWNDTAHCFTMTVQQRDQKKPRTFDRILPHKSFDQIVHYDRTVHDWFLEWTIWKCDARGGLLAPISSGFVIDKSPYSISDFVITPLGSGFQMRSKS